MICNSFIPVNDYNIRAQMLGGEQHLLSQVSVANQSAPATLSTVLVDTENIYLLEISKSYKPERLIFFQIFLTRSLGFNVPVFIIHRVLEVYCSVSVVLR